MTFPDSLVHAVVKSTTIAARGMGIACAHRTDDMIQVALTKVWRHWRKRGTPETALLRAIVRRACVDHLRDLHGRTGVRHALNNAFTTSEPLPGGEWPEDAIEDGRRHFDGPHEDELRAWLLSHHTEDSKAREIIERTLDGEPAVEIAKALGVSETWVSLVKKRCRDNYRPKIAAGMSPFDERLVA